MSATAKTETPVRVPQIRILRVLAKSKTPLNATLVAERAKVARTAVVGMLGSKDLKVRRNLEKLHNYVSLISRGYVKDQDITVDAEVSDRTERHYSITAAGRKFLDAQ